MKYDTLLISDASWSLGWLRRVELDIPSWLNH